MKVYVLLEEWDYEGSTLIDIFATREGAEAEAASRSEDWGRGPTYRVVEKTIIVT